MSASVPASHVSYEKTQRNVDKRNLLISDSGGLQASDLTSLFARTAQAGSDTQRRTLERERT
jgi:hypothetical protein